MPAVLCWLLHTGSPIAALTGAAMHTVTIWVTRRVPAIAGPRPGPAERHCHRPRSQGRLLLAAAAASAGAAAAAVAFCWCCCLPACLLLPLLQLLRFGKLGSRCWCSTLMFLSHCCRWRPWTSASSWRRRACSPSPRTGEAAAPAVHHSRHRSGHSPVAGRFSRSSSYLAVVAAGKSAGILPADPTSTCHFTPFVCSPMPGCSNIIRLAPPLIVTEQQSLWF